VPLYSDTCTLPSLSLDFSDEELNSNGRTNFILRVKEQAFCLMLRVHDDELSSGMCGVYYCNLLYHSEVRESQLGPTLDLMYCVS